MSTELATPTEQAPALMHPVTGELVPLDSPTEQLAEILDGTAEAHRLLGEFERILNGELLRRLDADATWTQRVGSGAAGYQFELKASSPDAGTSYYIEDELQQELDGLVKAGIISEAGAEKAMRRRLKMTLDVPWTADLDAMAEQLKRAGVRLNVCGVECIPSAIEPERKVIAAGVKALRKIKGAVQALDRAEHERDAPSRKVKVTRIGG